MFTGGYRNFGKEISACSQMKHTTK
uniref:Uncharacterized protein n=1 Tax=Arundo donax TaxID=35708 RepID=A0A0A8Y6Y8_ARUDO